MSNKQDPQACEDIKLLNQGIPGQQHYLLLACHVLWREFSQVAAKSRHELFPVFLRQGLHNEPDTLRKQLQEQIDIADKLAEKNAEDPGQQLYYDAILLGYGLCSNGIAGLTSKYHRIVVPRAHDCITIFLGDKNKYRDYFDKHPGVYWYCGGWLATGNMPGRERAEFLKKYYINKYEDEETAEFLLEEEKNWMDKYQEACFIEQEDLEITQQEHDDWRHLSRDCANYCGWKFTETAGSLRLVSNLVDGIWPEEDFLVIEPGQIIEPSYDAGIVQCKPD
ncbi:MAG: hypothetical protein PWP10_3362 [Clostridiales bacterium]|jgi:hypothetical protein|nr:hypothetical protein [Clostridiales bacterium]